MDVIQSMVSAFGEYADKGQPGVVQLGAILVALFTGVIFTAINLGGSLYARVLDGLSAKLGLQGRRASAADSPHP